MTGLLTFCFVMAAFSGGLFWIISTMVAWFTPYDSQNPPTLWEVLHRQGIWLGWVLTTGHVPPRPR